MTRTSSHARKPYAKSKRRNCLAGRQCGAWNRSVLRLKWSLPPADLYAHTYRFLRDKGFRFTEANESMTSLSTEGMAVGKSEIQLRIDLVIARADSGSVLSATADYLLTPGNWRPVAYRDSGTKYKVGFQELALLIQQLPHDGEIQYTVNEDRSRRAFSF